MNQKSMRPFISKTDYFHQWFFYNVNCIFLVQKQILIKKFRELNASSLFIRLRIKRYLCKSDMPLKGSLKVKNIDNSCKKFEQFLIKIRLVTKTVTTKTLGLVQFKDTFSAVKGYLKGENIVRLLSQPWFSDHIQYILESRDRDFQLGLI